MAVFWKFPLGGLGGEGRPPIRDITENAIHPRAGIRNDAFPERYHFWLVFHEFVRFPFYSIDRTIVINRNCLSSTHRSL